MSTQDKKDLIVTDKGDILALQVNCAKCGSVIENTKKAKTGKCPSCKTVNDFTGSEDDLLQAKVATEP